MTQPKYLLCIGHGDDDLTPGKVYRALPSRVSDRTARRAGLVRVIDDSGDDYLYPADYFLRITVPRAGRRAVARVTRPASKSPRPR